MLRRFVPAWAGWVPLVIGENSKNFIWQKPLFKLTWSAWVCFIGKAAVSGRRDHDRCFSISCRQLLDRKKYRNSTGKIYVTRYTHFDLFIFFSWVLSLLPFSFSHVRLLSSFYLFRKSSKTCLSWLFVPYFFILLTFPSFLSPQHFLVVRRVSVFIPFYQISEWILVIIYLS
jgi:hypothetical protein